MKIILSERNIVIVLFIMVLVTFSLAQEDTKKIEKGHTSVSVTITAPILAEQPATKPTLQPVDIKKQ